VVVARRMGRQGDFILVRMVGYGEGRMYGNIPFHVCALCIYRHLLVDAHVPRDGAMRVGGV
jgi:hypothetical protein